MSNTIVSPSRSAAIGPPATASGATCPAIRPRVAPEKRPSVSSTTDSPRPAPTMRGRHRQHLGHPRPALGSLAADDDDVARRDLVARARRRARAARLRRRAPDRGDAAGSSPPPSPRRPRAPGCPSGWPGRPWSLSADRAAARPPAPASRRPPRPPRRWCWPVTVGWPACSSPASSRRCATRRMPPARCRSVATNRPPGLRSASVGTLRLSASKSSIVERQARLARNRQQVQHRVGRPAGGAAPRRSRFRAPCGSGSAVGVTLASDQVHHQPAGLAADFGLGRIAWPAPSRCPSARCRGTRSPSPSCWR